MEIPLKGRLAQVPFPAIFAKIIREKRSGVLSLGDLETKKVQKRIGFKSGNQAYVAGGTINETLGRLLLKWGKIDEKQYRKIIANQKTDKKRTGEALVAMKILDGSQLAEALQLQTEEKILGCFTWPDGIYSFIEATPPDGKQLLFFEIRPEKLIAEGIRRYFNQQRLDQVLKRWQGAKFNRSASYAEVQQKMALAPREARVAQTFKDGFGFAELLAASPVDAINTLQVFFAMLVTGMIERVGSAPTSHTQAAPEQKAAAEPEPASRAVPPQKAAAPQPATDESVAPKVQASPEPASPPPQEKAAESQFGIEGEDTPEITQETATTGKAKPAPAAKKNGVSKEKEKQRKAILGEIANYEKIIKSGTFFDLLSVEREVSTSEIKKSFFRLAKKFHPDTNPEFFRGEFRERAEEVFTRIGEAYNTLIDTKAREEYVYALDHQISQEDLDMANRALEAEGVFVKAEILFKKGDFRGAQNLIEEAIKLNPDEPEYYVYLGWCQFKSTRGAAADQARESLQKSIDMGLRDKIDMANYYLGMLAKVQNRSIEEQRKYFSVAVEANPNNTLAASELRHIDMRAEKGAPKKAPAGKKKGGLFGRFKK